jgi:hypothetical protein
METFPFHNASVRGHTSLLTPFEGTMIERRRAELDQIYEVWTSEVSLFNFSTHTMNDYLAGRMVFDFIIEAVSN